LCVGVLVPCEPEYTTNQRYSMHDATIKTSAPSEPTLPVVEKQHLDSHCSRIDAQGSRGDASHRIDAQGSRGDASPRVVQLRMCEYQVDVGYVSLNSFCLSETSFGWTLIPVDTKPPLQRVVSVPFAGITEIFYGKHQSVARSGLFVKVVDDCCFSIIFMGSTLRLATSPRSATDATKTLTTSTTMQAVAGAGPNTVAAKRHVHFVADSASECRRLVSRLRLCLRYSGRPFWSPDK
jgi:hypothetical protein